MNECACGLIVRIDIVAAVDVIVVVTVMAAVVCVAIMKCDVILSLLNLKLPSFHRLVLL